MLERRNNNMIGNFNEEAQTVLMNAKKEMLDLGHPYIGTEHLLLSILKTNSNITERLNNYDLYYDNFKEELSKVVGTSKKKSEYFLYTPLLRKIIESAIMDSKDNNDGEVTIEHLFFSMLEEGEGIAIRILIGMDIDIESMYDDFSTSLIKKSKKNKKKKLLIDDLGVDLTNEAKNGKLDPVIGREKEVRRVMEILCRRTKNNPILIGDAGVGKTAIVEELSRLIANEGVPSGLIGKRVISLDMATMVAGTKYRGEFEERFEQRHLKIISDFPDGMIIIRADGRRLWRVLENLYTNAFKYAQEGSRVYVDVASVDGKAIFTMKNISEKPLNISPDELTERFVRGDVARTTEGSGLGLSIARSLTQLQKGEFVITIDGDLFKAQVIFPQVRQETRAEMRLERAAEEKQAEEQSGEKMSGEMPVGENLLESAPYNWDVMVENDKNLTAKEEILIQNGKREHKPET